MLLISLRKDNADPGKYNSVSRLCDEVGVMRGVVVEDEAWHSAQDIHGKARRAEKDVEMALLFPFAPNATSSPSSLPPSDNSDGECYFTTSNPTLPQQQQQQRQRRRPQQLDWRNMLSPSHHSSPPYTTAEDSLDDHYSAEEKMTLKSSSLSHQHNAGSRISGYESIQDSDFAEEDPYFYNPSLLSPVMAAPATTTHGAAADKSGEYEGLEGIYKFLQICEEVKR